MRRCAIDAKLAGELLIGLPQTPVLERDTGPTDLRSFLRLVETSLSRDFGRCISEKAYECDTATSAQELSYRFPKTRRLSIRKMRVASPFPFARPS